MRSIHQPAGRVLNPVATLLKARVVLDLRLALVASKDPRKYAYGFQCASDPIQIQTAIFGSLGRTISGSTFRSLRRRAIQHGNKVEKRMI